MAGLVPRPNLTRVVGELRFIWERYVINPIWLWICIALSIPIENEADESNFENFGKKWEINGALVFLRFCHSISVGIIEIRVLIPTRPCMVRGGRPCAETELDARCWWTQIYLGKVCNRSYLILDVHCFIYAKWKKMSQDNGEMWGEKALGVE